jgi:Polyketide cyclase / dehydrase and lipid transport
MQMSAPMELVWSIVSDPERQLDFMDGMTRWELDSKLPAGLGARYRMLFAIGSAEVGGLVEIVEWSAPSDLAWTSVTGIDQRGRWRLRAGRNGGTRVEFRLAYGVAGSGLWGWVAERVAAPVVASHLRSSLEQLRRLAVQEQRRARADARASTTA